MAPDEKTDPASPVCYLGEGDPGYAGYLSDTEVAAELRRLMGRVSDDRLHAKLLQLARELEARCLKD
jgi:hypothetical protein